MPIWLLGSSLFSAQLAAERGLPYAFASHFAPRYLLDALAVYRSGFKPSATLDKPYVAIGVPLIAAPTDDEADYLASSTYQRVLGILKGDRRKLQPPTVRAGLTALAQATDADEFLLVSDVYDPALRLQSLDVAAGVMAAA